MWDTSSFIVGIFVGILILIIIFWIAYGTRTFIFTTTPRDYPQCVRSDYLNNPSQALADGYTTDQILSINSSQQMEYQRVPQNVCVPGPNQVVHIKNPQFCTFIAKSDVGEFSFEARNHFFESPFYTSTSTIDGEIVEVITEGDCKPQSNTDPNIIVTNGVPLLRWEQ